MNRALYLVAATILGVHLYAKEELSNYRVIRADRGPAPTDQVSYVFSHGVIDNHTQVKRLLNLAAINDSHPGSWHNRYLINPAHGPVVSYDYPDAIYALWRSDCGQDKDMETAKQALLNAKQDSMIPDPTVLLGISRGASVCISIMGKYKNELDHIQALVLESPFSSVESMRLDWAECCTMSKSKWLGMRIASALLKFKVGKTTGNSPEFWANSIRKDLPILIVCSLQDTTVPATTSIRLYSELIKTGHTNAHLLVLEQGKHANLLAGPNGANYCHTVHAFYRKYGLPHNEKWADFGSEILATTQPNNNE